MAAAKEFILGLDVGSVRTGVAIAHGMARLPRPLTTLTNNDSIFEAIQKLVVDEHVARVVVGLPRGMDGGYTEQTRQAEAFQQKLAGMLDVPVELSDETLTSVQAEAELAGSNYTKADVDAIAACYILESYFTELANQKVEDPGL